MSRIYLFFLLPSILSLNYSFGQCTVEPNANEMTNLVCQGGTTYRSGVAFNPNHNIYYTVNSGSPSYPIETYDVNGTYLNTIAQGFDYRGLWWNSTLNQLDGNGYSSSGIYVQDLNMANGYPLGTGTTVISGMNQPANHSCGQFDPVNNEIIYYDGGNIERYDRSTGVYVTATPITGLPVPVTNLNTTSIGYTGCTGMEVVVYDYVLQRVYFINLSTGAYVATSQLPGSAPTESNQRMSFSNDLFWLFDVGTLTWKSYGVVETCVETYGTVTPTACNIYTSPSGNHSWASTGIYMDTIPNYEGCDSVLTIDLTIINSATGTDTRTECNSYTWIDGNTYTVSNNMATFNIVGGAANGCDSTVTLDLTINNSTSGTDVITACDNYTWIDGVTYTTSNNSATYLLTNTAGCDSTVTLDLTINNVSDLTTTTSGVTISANNSGMIYQWLDCNNNHAIIPGETGQSYTATVNGNYAVELTENGCTDTTACVAITTVGIIETSFGDDLIVYPNPTNGNFSIDLGAIYESSQIYITDVSGRLISSKTIIQSQVLNLSIESTSGIYFVSIEAGDKNEVIRLVKE